MESYGPGQRPDCPGDTPRPGDPRSDEAHRTDEAHRADDLHRHDGRRDNGLAAEHYVALADLDPRVADALLGDLAEAGIAAYVVPTPGRRGGYLDTQVPARHTDRVFVDVRGETGARTLLDSASPAEPDEDAAWRAIVEGFSAPSAEPVPPWPVTEDLDGPPVATTSRVVQRPADDFVGEAFDLDSEDHYVPPPPPPPPRLRAVTVAALAAIAAGVALLALPGVLDYTSDGTVQVLAVCLMLGGFASLVYRMQDGPHDDDDPDDGAVV